MELNTLNKIGAKLALQGERVILNALRDLRSPFGHHSSINSKAELVVATWAKQFHDSEIAQKVPLLYLANDILQNSKRKGNEFVAEFWKVLPVALKDLIEKGDDHGKNVVSRLVDIWGERRVFGSRGQSLKDVMLGEQLPQPLEFSRKRSRSVRIVKRDSRSIRTKLTIGGAAERIVSAFHLALSEHSGEDEEMNKCKSAVHRVRKMEKDVDLALTKAKDPKRSTLAKELEEEENNLKQCLEKLKVVEANRLALVSQLREALNEQESELENVRTQVQVAQAQTEEARNMRKRLDEENYVSNSKASSATPPVGDVDAKAGQGSKKTAAAIAAEVADRLAASSSSQYIMSSVLSTFAAEEAKSAGLTKASTATNSNSKTDPPLPAVSDPNGFMPTNSSYQSVLVPQTQAQYHKLTNPPSHQYLHPSGGIVTTYGHGSVPPLPPGPPPPPPPSYMLSPMVPLTQQPLQMTHQPSLLTLQQPLSLPHQPPAPPSFRPLGPMQPPGMVYYAHHHHSQ
ncbi:hypothetical protein RJ639_010185 [Escallonia herrerae]|uniref:CID domain-containing protein n=1 Tax=Escallonia herrerae TaxID=1293975 RepID=A0AA88VYV1_9ASTE|nr:hypothetical protein RJ639_010185 [Escallonia herrerae]